ncbi:hypothetical protein GGQ85_003239 [Nitrobacter vulgaris]|nr:hypothetical protein [Nitrobacter vulgaris]
MMLIAAFSTEHGGVRIKPKTIFLPRTLRSIGYSIFERSG